MRYFKIEDLHNKGAEILLEIETNYSQQLKL